MPVSLVRREPEARDLPSTLAQINDDNRYLREWFDDLEAYRLKGDPKADVVHRLIEAMCLVARAAQVQITTTRGDETVVDAVLRRDYKNSELGRLNVRLIDSLCRYANYI